MNLTNPEHSFRYQTRVFDILRKSALASSWKPILLTIVSFHLHP